MLDNDAQMDADRLEPISFSRSGALTVDTVSPEIYAQSRKNHANILRALARVKQTEVATSLGVNDSTITRWKDEGSLERTAKMLAVLGFKLVPAEAKCFMALED